MNDETTKRPKKARKRTPKPKPEASPPARPIRYGCGFGERGCGGERIHDWPRARAQVRVLLRAGRLTLCARHLDMLERAEGA